MEAKVFIGRDRSGRMQAESRLRHRFHEKLDLLAKTLGNPFHGVDVSIDRPSRSVALNWKPLVRICAPTQIFATLSGAPKISDKLLSQLIAQPSKQSSNRSRRNPVRIPGPSQSASSKLVSPLRPSEGALKAITWNAQALLHHKPQVRQSKTRFLDELMRDHQVIVLQESHGTREEALRLLRWVGRMWWLWVFPEPDRATAGTIILVAKSYAPDRSQLSARDMCPRGLVAWRC